MVAIVDVGFCIDVIVFVELILVGLGTNRTVFLPVAEVLVVSTFGVTISLVTLGCRVELHFGGVC